MSAAEHAEPPRYLIVFRHAKAAWPADLADHERPLAPRGRRDAPAAGRWLRETGWRPDRVLCSTAERTRQTWSLAAAELAGSPPVAYDDRVYDASVPLLFDVLRETPTGVDTLVLVGHNPGMHHLALALAGNDSDAEALGRVRAKFATGALAVFAVPVGWDALGHGVAALTDAAVPRG